MAPIEIRAGRRVAALFDAHGAMVLGLCHTILRDHRDAEDAAQQTFLNAHRALLNGTTPLDPPAWLATIARNECRTRISRRLSAPNLVPLTEGAVSAASTADPEERADEHAQVDALTSALAELPERQREAVVLRDLYGLSYNEVAAAMSISAPAVESLLSRGRRGLQERVRPLRVARGALVLPVELRDELARLIPGFASETSAAAAAGGATGVLAKLASGSLAAKVAAGAAVATVAVGSDVALVDRAVDRAAARDAPAVRIAAPEGTARLVRAVRPATAAGGPASVRVRNRLARAGARDAPTAAAARAKLPRAEEAAGAPVAVAPVPEAAAPPARAEPDDAPRAGGDDGGGGGSSGPGGGGGAEGATGTTASAAPVPATPTPTPEPVRADNSGSGSTSSGSGSSGSGSGTSGGGGGNDAPDAPDAPDEPDEPDEPDD